MAVREVVRGLSHREALIATAAAPFFFPLPLREGVGGGVRRAERDKAIYLLPPTLPSPSRGEGQFCFGGVTHGAR